MNKISSPVREDDVCLAELAEAALLARAEERYLASIIGIGLELRGGGGLSGVGDRGRRRYGMCVYNMYIYAEKVLRRIYLYGVVSAYRLWYHGAAAMSGCPLYKELPNLKR